MPLELNIANGKTIQSEKMDNSRFDVVAKQLTNEWEFEALLNFYQENAVRNFKHLEFCVYLADIGLLDELHKFISQSGLYNLKALANDPKCAYEKSENVKFLLNVYEAEMLAIFERRPSTLSGIDGNLLNFAQYSDKSILKNYIEKNKDIVFQVDQPPKTLMYLTYAINKILNVTAEGSILKLVLDHLDGFKKINAIRKAYITKLITLRLLSHKNVVTFPKAGYKDLQVLLALIVSQKTKYNGADRLYKLVAATVRPELKSPVATKKFGSNSKPKVAVCISGMYRCGHLALDSIYESVIEPLEADVFFHSWTEMQDWPGLGGAGDEWLIRIFNKDIFNKSPVALRSKKYFKEKFPRTYSILDTASYSIFDTTQLPENIKFKKIQLEDPVIAFQEQKITENNFLSAGSLNQAKMFYGIYKSHELALEHERENDFRYDYIIRCRPDVGLHNKVSFADLEKLTTHDVAIDFNKMVGPTDQVWYAQRSAALSMASLWSASIESNALSPFPDFPHMRAHGLMLGWMVHNHLQPVYIPVKREIAMATGGSSPPDFAAALAEDFTKEAYDLSQNEEYVAFFNALQEFNR